MHQHIAAAGTFARMKPYQLVLGLMAQQGIAGALPLAKAANVAKKQPQIHRWLDGSVSEPKRATLEPLAKFFDLPIEALYDEREATRIARDRGIPDPLPTLDKRPRQRRASQVGELLKQVEQLSPKERQELLRALAAAPPTAEVPAAPEPPKPDFTTQRTNVSRTFKPKAVAPEQTPPAVVRRGS